MIRLLITPAAFDAVADTLPLGSVGYERQPDAKGEVAIWVDVSVANRLGAMRQPGESMSDVILRFAALEARARAKVDTLDELVRIVGEIEPRKAAAAKRGTNRRPARRRRR